jgi:F-type H+-transporting ATPase subunit b
MILFTLLTFGLLLAILRIFAWTPILGLLEDRERTVRESLESARRAREEAEAALAENRRILTEARRAAGEIVDRASQEAGQVKAAILEKARQEHEDLRRRGREEIDREKRAAIREIRGIAADLALTAAGKLIEGRMDDETSRRLVEEYLQELEGEAPRRVR